MSLPERIQRFCARVACALAFCLFAALFISGLLVTARLCKQSWAHEAIVFSHNGIFSNLLLTVLTLCAVMLFHRLLERFSGVKLGAALLGAWSLGTLALVIGANVVQMYDFAYVLEGAQLFARGNYKPMTIDYFNVYSYQLGICLPMEIVQRILPSLNLSLFMQMVNVFLSAGIAGIMAALSSITTAKKAESHLSDFFIRVLLCLFLSFSGTETVRYCHSTTFAILCQV